MELSLSFLLLATLQGFLVRSANVNKFEERRTNVNRLAPRVLSEIEKWIGKRSKVPLVEDHVAAVEHVTVKKNTVMRPVQNLNLTTELAEVPLIKRKKHSKKSHKKTHTKKAHSNSVFAKRTGLKHKSSHSVSRKSKISPRNILKLAEPKMEDKKYTENRSHLLRAELGELSKLARRISAPMWQRSIHNSLAKSLASKKKEIAATILKKLMQRNREVVADKKHDIPATMEVVSAVPALQLSAVSVAAPAVVPGAVSSLPRGVPTVEAALEAVKKHAVAPAIQKKAAPLPANATNTPSTNSKKTLKEQTIENIKTLKEQVAPVALKKENSKKKHGLKKFEISHRDAGAEEEEEEEEPEDHEDGGQQMEADAPMPQYGGALPPYSQHGGNPEAGPIGAYDTREEEQPYEEGQEEEEPGFEREASERGEPQQPIPIPPQQPQQPQQIQQQFQQPQQLQQQQSYFNQQQEEEGGRPEEESREAEEEGQQGESPLQQQGESPLRQVSFAGAQMPPVSVPQDSYRNYFRYMPSMEGEAPRFLPYEPRPMEQEQAPAEPQGEAQVTGEKKSTTAANPEKGAADKKDVKGKKNTLSRKKLRKVLPKSTKRYGVPYYPRFYQQPRMMNVPGNRRSYYPTPLFTPRGQMEMTRRMEMALSAEKHKQNIAKKSATSHHRNFKQERDHLVNLHHDIKSKVHAMDSLANGAKHHDNNMLRFAKKSSSRGKPSTKSSKRQSKTTTKDVDSSKRNKIEEETQDVKNVDMAMDNLVDKIIANALGRAIIDPAKKIHST